MKKLCIPFFAICCFTLAEASFAQKPSKYEVIGTAEQVIFENEPKFICKKIIYNEKTKIVTLLNNVSLKTDKFEFSNAGKAVYNEKTKKLVIYDCKEFTIDGKLIAVEGRKKKNTVEYTIGDDTVYML